MPFPGLASFGDRPAIPDDPDALVWSKIAIMMARGDSYGGKSSPWWYDIPHFHELLLASGGTLVSELVKQLDGCTGTVGEIVADAGLARTACKDVRPRPH
jgi:hypothetical protein